MALYGDDSDNASFHDGGGGDQGDKKGANSFFSLFLSFLSFSFFCPCPLLCSIFAEFCSVAERLLEFQSGGSLIMVVEDLERSNGEL